MNPIISTSQSERFIGGGSGLEIGGYRLKHARQIRASPEVGIGNSDLSFSSLQQTHILV